jgi:hypothetical protein
LKEETMLKPPAATMPGMTDTLDFVKNLWGSMNIPGANLSGMSAPTLSAEDLDKRIADLKAVESWLNVNVTMLRGTIQTMEVQRATLATLKSMSSSMAEAMRQSGVSPDKMAAMPFASFFGQPAQGASAAPPSATAPASSGGSAQPGAGAPASGDAAGAMAPALAWWNVLQEQFAQAVTTAMTPTSAPASAASPAPAQPTAAGSDGGARPPQQQPQSQPKAEQAPPQEGDAGGKARTGKPRADKA